MKIKKRGAFLWAFVFAFIFNGISKASGIELTHESTVQEDLIGNLYTMKTLYSAEYAPAAWKKAYAGYDLETEFAKALAAAQAKPDMTLKEARRILKNFIYAMKDYHTSISFLGTELATLPFAVRGTADKEFIVYIDRAKASEAAFPFHVGDELVTFDGKPAIQAVQELMADRAENVPATDKILSEGYLTNRQTFRGYDIPSGPVTIGVRPKGQTQVVNFQMIWEYTPELIHPRGPLGTRAHTPEPGARPQKRNGLFSPGGLFRPQMSFETFDASDAAQPNPFNRGARKAFTPPLGTKIWESAETDFFHAYIYRSPDQRLIGYIRIPSYGASDFVKAVADFDKAVALFEATTDAVVIDQVDNPGGSVFYLYALASRFAKQPLATPRHRMALNQADVAEALTTIDQLSKIHNEDEALAAISPADLDGYTPSYAFVQFSLSYARFIVSEWNAGRKLTRPYWIGGVDQINPAPNHYTKPVLVLINPDDFSGGDFFPAILQDNKRVTLFGTRTAGAGGYVLDVKIQNNLGINAFRCTESLAERVDLNPIENLGVKPEIEYELTEADYQNGFSPYVEAIHRAVKGISNP